MQVLYLYIGESVWSSISWRATFLPNRDIYASHFDLSYDFPFNPFSGQVMIPLSLNKKNIIFVFGDLQISEKTLFSADRRVRAIR